MALASDGEVTSSYAIVMLAGKQVEQEQTLEAEVEFSFLRLASSSLRLWRAQRLHAQLFPMELNKTNKAQEKSAHK